MKSLTIVLEHLGFWLLEMNRICLVRLPWHGKDRTNGESERDVASENLFFLDNGASVLPKELSENHMDAAAFPS